MRIKCSHFSITIYKNKDRITLAKLAQLFVRTLTFRSFHYFGIGSVCAMQ